MPAIGAQFSQGQGNSRFNARATRDTSASFEGKRTPRSFYQVI
ncbi:MAG: hypothetical protein WA040_05220 [Anaerolineae bacterium]